MTILLPPAPTNTAARSSLNALLTNRSLLLAMKALRDELGDIFLLPMPGFKAVVLSGPEAAHFTYVKARTALRWRTEDDPVTGLLRHGLLVEDGESHDDLRHGVMPYLHRQWAVICKRLLEKPTRSARHGIWANLWICSWKCAALRY